MTSLPAARRLAIGGALLLVLCACRSTYEPCTGDLAADLAHGDPRCRSAAAVRAEEQGRLDLFPLLLDNLRDPNGDVRLFTAVAVSRLSGLDTGYNSAGSRFEQEEAIARWREWWESREPALRGTDPQRSLRDTYDESHGRVLVAPGESQDAGPRASSGVAAEVGAPSGS